jgi:hypothetical protein
MREKLFKNQALKSMDAVRAKLKQAILYFGAQSQARSLHHFLPLYRQFTLI